MLNLSSMQTTRQLKQQSASSTRAVQSRFKFSNNTDSIEGLRTPNISEQGDQTVRHPQKIYPNTHVKNSPNRLEADEYRQNFERLAKPYKLPKGVSKKLGKSIVQKRSIYGSSVNQRLDFKHESSLESKTFSNAQQTAFVPDTTLDDEFNSQNLYDYHKLKKNDLIQLLYLANQKISQLNRQLADQEKIEPSEQVAELENALTQKDI